MAIDANVQSTATGRGHPAIAVATPGSLALEPQLHRVERVSAGLWRDAGRRLMRDRAALVGLAVVAVLIVVAIVAPSVTPTRPTTSRSGSSWRRPAANIYWVPTNLDETSSAAS